MKKKIRIVVDCGMVLLLPLLMAYSLVGEAAHEYLGIGMFLLFAAHHILNAAWWKHLLRGRYTPLRILGTAVNLALAIIMLALPISGMILSRHVFRFLHLGGVAVARTVHLLASYWGLVLMSVHAGMHGSMVSGMLRKNAQEPSRARTWGRSLLMVLIALTGIRAFLYHNITSYLFLRTQFVFVDPTRPLVLVLLEYLAILALFALLGYMLSALLRQQNKKRQRISTNP